MSRSSLDDPDMTNPEEIVRKAEAAYLSLDIDRIMALFDRDIVQVWEGNKRIDGWDALRRAHLMGFLRILPDGSVGIQDYSLKKTLRMACDDMIAVEFVSSFLDRRTGDWFEDRGGEFWWIKDDRLVEWHGYQTTERKHPTVHMGPS